MRRTRFLFLRVFVLAIALAACEEDEVSSRARAAFEKARLLAKQREEMKKHNVSAKKKREERDTKGDTVALSTEILADFLPKSYATYQKNGVPINSPAQINGGAFSTIEQTYSSQNQNIRLTIRDSNKGVSTHAGIGKMWSRTPPTNTKKARGSYVLLAGKFHAWEYYEKRTRRAGLLIDVSDRIYIELIATEQMDTDAVKGLVIGINLDKLAKY